MPTVSQRTTGAPRAQPRGQSVSATLEGGTVKAVLTQTHCRMAGTSDTQRLLGRHQEKSPSSVNGAALWEGSRPIRHH